MKLTTIMISSKVNPRRRVARFGTTAVRHWIRLFMGPECI